VAGVALSLEKTDVQATHPIVVLLVSLLTLVIFSFRRRPLRFGLAVAAVLLANPAEIDQRVHGLHSERSFFGLHRVLTDSQARFHILCNGSTVHGIQRYRPALRREPLGYYSQSGPLGDIFRAANDMGRTRAVGVLGLGAGGFAAYAQPGQHWTYYEIDPAVNRIANDPRMFTYLSGSPAPLRVVLGDARLSLSKSAETFDLIVLDAYSSDAIPVHLLTRESLQLYLQHLSPDGLLVFHLSNQYFRLAPVVGALARDAGLTCRVRFSGAVSDSAAENGIMASVYAVAARAPGDLGSLLTAPSWKPVKLQPNARMWTDDYSSLGAALRR
jgi:SAM-dependent methyltransferase